MDREDIIRMARETGHSPAQIDIVCRFAAVLEDFAAFVADAEREACAKVCEGVRLKGREVFADAIRARSKT